MKKFVFSSVVCIILLVITLLPFFLPDDNIYVHKKVVNVIKPWFDVWMTTFVWIALACISYCYFSIGEWLYEYIRKED